MASTNKPPEIPPRRHSSTFSPNKIVNQSSFGDSQPNSPSFLPRRHSSCIDDNMDSETDSMCLALAACSLVLVVSGNPTTYNTFDQQQQQQQDDECLEEQQSPVPLGYTKMLAAKSIIAQPETYNVMRARTGLADSTTTLQQSAAAYLTPEAPIAQYAAAPITQYAAAPISRLAAAPITRYTAAPITQYAAAPIAQYAAAPIAQYAAAPISRLAAAPITRYTAAPIPQYAAAAPIISNFAATAAAQRTAISNDMQPTIMDSAPETAWQPASPKIAMQASYGTGGGESALNTYDHRMALAQANNGFARTSIVSAPETAWQAAPPQIALSAYPAATIRPTLFNEFNPAATRYGIGGKSTLSTYDHRMALAQANNGYARSSGQFDELPTGSMNSKWTESKHAAAARFNLAAASPDLSLRSSIGAQQLYAPMPHSGIAGPARSQQLFGYTGAAPVIEEELCQE